METIGEKLRLLRSRKGLTQGAVASGIGVERSTYSYYELGKTLPDWNMIKKLANFFDVNYYALLEEENKYIFRDNVSGNIRSREPEILTPEEKKIISTIRNLSSENRKRLIDFIRLLGS